MNALIENDNSEEANLRRIAIYNGQADFMYGFADIAKSQGVTQEAEAFKALADSCWGDCAAAASDLTT